ncbi:MAG: hypothetical protein WHV67_02465 [Thermoanaerobaculia bacterium]
MKRLFVLFFIVISGFVFSQGGYECKITVTNPKEGDTWYVGNTYDITWRSSDYCPSYLYSIKLFGNRSSKETLLYEIKNTPNDGKQPFTPLSDYLGYDYYYFKFYAEYGGGGDYRMMIPIEVGRSANFFIKEVPTEDFSIYPQRIGFMLYQNSTGTKEFYIIPKKEYISFILNTTQNWINFEPGSGSAYFGDEPFKVNLTASSYGLEVGNYEGEVKVSNPEGTFSLILYVYLAVIPQAQGTPHLEVDSNRIIFRFAPGELPPPYYINLKNTGDGDAYFIVDRISSFLKITPSKGVLIPNSSIQLKVELNLSQELVGTKKGFIRIIDQMGNSIYIFCLSNSVSQYSDSNWTPTSTPSKTLPIAATGLGGAYGSFWSTDVFGVLMSSSFVEKLENIKENKGFKENPLREKAAFIWGAVGKKVRTQQARTTEFELTDESPSLFVDFLNNFFGMESASSFIQMRGDMASRVALFSRTYSTDSEGKTYGQFIGSTTDDNVIGSSGGKAVVFGLRNDENFRSNLFITELDGLSTNVTVQLYNHLGQAVGNPLNKTLEGFSQWQIIDVFGKTGASGNWAFAEITSSGGGRISALGSSIDKKTNDPVTLPPVIPSSTRATGNLYLPAVVASPGANQTNWRTDLVFMNYSDNSLNVPVEFYSRDGNLLDTKYITLLPKNMGIYIDAIKTLFGKDNEMGSLIVKNVDTSNFFLFGRIYNLKEDGSTLGQGTLAYKDTESTTLNDTPIFTMGVESSPNFRSNVGVFETSGQSAKVLFTFIFPDGESRNFVKEIKPHQWIQFNNIIPSNTGYSEDVSGVWIVLSVIEGAGKISGYASIVDNLSSDATFIKFIKP